MLFENGDVKGCGYEMSLGIGKPNLFHSTHYGWQGGRELLTLAGQAPFPPPLANSKSPLSVSTPSRWPVLRSG
jgi:hypothetical protein